MDLGFAGTATFSGPNDNIALTSWNGAGVFTPGVHAQAGIKVGRGIVSGKGLGVIATIAWGKGFTIKFNSGSNGAWDLSILGGIGSPHAAFMAGPTTTVNYKKGERVEGVACP